MFLLKKRFLLVFIFWVINISPLTISSSNAASVLASWLLTSEGTLKLRTSPSSKLDAYFQSGYGSIGDRVWIDFPGELIKPRKLKGNGPVKEIRLGKPYKGSTRLVIEFQPQVSLNYSQLKLLGTSPNLWELDLKGLNTNGLRSIGEGDLFPKISSSKVQLKTLPLINDPSEKKSLPYVQRDKYLVVIDPGHGGPDTGAVGIDGLRETDVVLDISKKVAKHLSKQGVIVRLTRDRNIDINLEKRVLIANRLKADAFISIHANATRGYRRDISGIETYFYSGVRGRQLASEIQTELVALPGGSPNRGVRQNRFYVIRKTDMPAALVEVGFVTGRLDSRLLSQLNHRKEISFAIAKGILQFLKETY